eukprot:g1671.t1
MGAERGARYLQTVSSRRVKADTSDLARLDPGLPDVGMDEVSILDLMENVGGKGTVATASGRYFGYVIGGALPAASAARALLSAWDQVADALTGPSVVHMEETAIRWAVDLLGLPSGTDGAFTTGATMSNMALLVTARDTLLARQGHERGAGLLGAPKLRIVASAEIHATVLKSVRMAGLATNDIEWVPVDGEGRLRLDDVPELDDRTLVLAQAGNVCTGAFDPFEALGDLCSAAGAWLHIDGAFGLWARASEQLGHSLAGLEKADSWVVDSHKTLNTPYDAALALCRHPKEMEASMAIGAGYLPVAVSNPANRAPEFSRSARGAETWAALLSLGRSGVAEMVERFHRHAVRIAGDLKVLGFEVPHQVHFNQVFATLPAAEEACALIADHVQRSGEAWFGQAVWQGQKGFRISVSNWSTTEEDVSRLIAAIAKAKEELDKEIGMDWTKLDLVDLRRDLHRNPELGFQLDRTKSKVASTLRALGLEVHEGIGVVGLLRAGNGNKAIGLRADMDALPIHELSSHDYVSQSPGKMHACGHDGHTAMLLGAAAQLARDPGFDGTVVFLFQPDEEQGRGARAMIDDGLLDRFPIEEVYGIHNLPGAPLGQVSTRVGQICASESLFEIEVTGKGGHASMPQTGVDAITVGSELVLALQTIVSRKLAPGAGAVVSVTEFLTDGQRNVLPGRATLKGDVRARHPEDREAVEGFMRQIVAGVAQSHGVAATMSFRTEFKETINAVEPVAAVLRAAGAAGLEAVGDREPMSFSEDFGQFADARRVGDAAQRILTKDAFDRACAEIMAWPGYDRTPLHALGSLAAAIGVGEVFYKHEGARFGLGSFKALGGAFAAQRVLQREVSRRKGWTVSLTDIRGGRFATDCAEITLVSATDGNHGRSLAWGCKRFGAPCRIYIHAEVSEGRAEAMRALGADVIRIKGDYDASVELAKQEAAENGWFVVSDTSWPGYSEPPLDVMSGYGVMTREICADLKTPPSHVFLQGGVGGLAAGVAAGLRQYWGEKAPRVVIVEPDRAACLFESAKTGQPTTVAIEEETIMAGLSCGEPSELAWEILAEEASDFLTLPDVLIAPTVRLLARPLGDDPVIEAGETSGKPVAVIPEIGAALMRQTWLSDIRTWSAPSPGDDGISLLTDLLSPLASRKERIGVLKGHETSLRMPLGDWEKLLSNLPGLDVADATPLIKALRMVKSPAEIEKLSHICAIGSATFEQVREFASEGVPLEEVFRSFKRAALLNGADDVPYLVGAAAQGGYADVISPPTREPLRCGDILMLDTGAVWDGYFCDFDRNWAVGHTDDTAKHAYEVLWRATEAGLEAAKPGASCLDLFLAMNKVIGEMDTSGGDVGRLGHGLGMQLTEWPSHALFDETVIEENMVLTLEPSLSYGEGLMMVHEEDVVIRAGGAELLTRRAPSELPVMDDIDLEILRRVQSNARLTADALAEEIGLSSPAIQKRLKKLRETGVIEKEIAVLSPSSLGREMTVIVQVMLERESRQKLDDFKRLMRRAPEVQQCYYATGEADFILILVVKDIKEYEEFTQEYFFGESNVSRFTTSIVMDRVKVSLDIL